jgi:LruC domain-containing protein
MVPGTAVFWLDSPVFGGFSWEKTLSGTWHDYCINSHVIRRGTFMKVFNHPEKGNKLWFSGTAVGGTSGRTGKRSGLAVLLLAALTLGSCRFELFPPDGPKMEKPWTQVIPAGFDFATSRSVDFDLDISVRYAGSTPGSNVIEPYSGRVRVLHLDANGDYELLGAGVADEDGKAAFKVVVPADITRLSIQPVGFGLFDREILIDPSTTAVRLTIHPEDSLPASSSLTASASRSAAGLDRVFASRSLESRNLTDTTEFMVVSGYDELGVPSSLVSPRPSQALTREFLDDIAANFPDNEWASSDLNVTMNALTNIVVTQEATVSVTFIHEATGFRNALGYFVYPTANGPPASPPQAEKVMIVFPNASYMGSGGGINTGDHIRLVGTDGSVQLVNPATGGNTFYPGTTIAWILVQDGFGNNGVSTDKTRLYTVPKYNPDFDSLPANEKAKAIHASLLRYDNPDRFPKKVFILGFKDRKRNMGKNDFKDTIVAIEVDPPEAVATELVSIEGIQTMAEAVYDPEDSDGDGVPNHLDEFPYDPSRAYTSAWPSKTGWGSVLYEDLWPSLGDYDFNDLVADVRVTTVANAAGKAVDVVVDVVVKAAGGGLPTSLSLSLRVPHTAVVSLTGNRLGANSFFDVAANGVEADEGRSVVPLFDNTHELFGVTGDELETGNGFVNSSYTKGTSKDPVELTVIVALDGTTVPATDITGTLPDFFTIINKDRSLEIHAIGQLPGKRVNKGRFGTKDDGSDVQAKIFYRSKGGAPWAMILPVSMPWPSENVEFSEAFVHFRSWVQSGGSSHTDWYLPKSGYRNEALLYTMTMPASSE